MIPQPEDLQEYATVITDSIKPEVTYQADPRLEREGARPDPMPALRLFTALQTSRGWLLLVCLTARCCSGQSLISNRA